MKKAVQNVEPPVAPVFDPNKPLMTLDWPTIAAAVFAAKGITSGWFRLGLGLQFAGTTVKMGPPGGTPVGLPVGMVGVSELAIFPAEQGGDMTFDAGANGAPVPEGAIAPSNSTRQAKRPGSRKRSA
jgi:hypothetical protein